MYFKIILVDILTAIFLSNRLKSSDFAFIRLSRDSDTPSSTSRITFGEFITILSLKIYDRVNFHLTFGTKLETTESCT